MNLLHWLILRDFSKTQNLNVTILQVPIMWLSDLASDLDLMLDFFL